jgi:serine/threonine protein kinase
MSNRDDAGETQSLGAAAEQIDQVCDRFEADWRSGKQPRIEDALLQGPHFARNNLFRELLEIEVEVRQQGGETLAADQYRGRFPEFGEVIDTVFAKAAGPKRLGDYELLEELGKGGMGVVYRARHVLLNQTVALKLLPERFLNEPQAISRFRREMQSIGGLDHPNIVRAHNAGEADRQHFLVMEYVDGINLQQLVIDYGPLPVGAACEMIRQAALGLQHAHEHGLVHRDVKPANLMLNRRGTVKILDLGLARLHASQLSQGLTQEGIPMGTVDYMAPEQWEDSSRVDIRADIYSLGCTLFHLVAGQAPYADTTYDTNRKKLMAHTVAPIPIVSQRREDAPEELDDVLGLMMAKEPHERFETPTEVAEALEPFADAAEIDAIVAAVMARPAAGAVSDAGIKNSNVDTAKRLRRDSAVSKRPSSRLLRSPPRRPWYRVRPAVWAGAGASLALLLLAWLLWPSPAPPERKHLQTEVALLPSLNGGWWADEMPWLTPFVRRAIIDAMEKNRTYRKMANGAADARGLLVDPNVPAVHQRLRDWIEQIRQKPGALTPRQEALSAELRALAEDDLTDAELREQLLSSVEAFCRDAGDVESWAAEDVHALAVLEHKLVALGPDAKLADKAKTQYVERWATAARAHYDLARDKYGESAGQATALGRLCLSDAAQLHYLYLGGRDDAAVRYKREVKPRFEQAIADMEGNGAVLFRADVLINQGMAAHDAVEYKDCDHALMTAKDLLAKSDVGKRNHPLLAFVDERYAWALVDRWIIGDAATRFSDALHIREDNLKNGNDAAQIHVFHDRHGKAIVQRYRGDVAGARREFETLLTGETGIKQALRNAAGRRGGTTQRYLRDLRERLYNSSERYGDCYLYQGVASVPNAAELGKACTLYEQAQREAEDPRVKTAMTFKWAIALALGGNTEAAAEKVKTARRDMLVQMGVEDERGQLLRQVAEAVLLTDKDPEAGHQALSKFLSQCKDGSIATDWKRRETLELQFFCAELLISSELASKEPQAAREHVQKYLKDLTGALPAEQMLKFLWRFYDLAIRALGTSDAQEVLYYVREAHGRPQLKPGETLLAFHFSEDQGIVVVRLPGEEKGAVIPLTDAEGKPYGRQRVKNDALAGTVLEPPVKLVEALKNRPNDGKIQWLWSDEGCFPDVERALADKADWPFGDRLGVRP